MDIQEWTKANRVRIAKQIIDMSGSKSSDTPVAIFMAGLPGSGKTEFLDRFLKGSQLP